jgi:hypothetical protein
MDTPENTEEDHSDPEPEDREDIEIE